MKKEKPKVGDILYSLNIGNAARYRPQVLTKVTVTKVGRKYFTCTPDGYHFGSEYYLDDWSERTNYCQNSKLYSSAKEFEDENERESICKLVHESFEHRRNKKSVSLEDLRKIKEILDKYT